MFICKIIKYITSYKNNPYPPPYQYAGRVDMHIHTTCSDGTFSPSRLITYAKNLGLSAISITDHDTVAAYPYALQIGHVEELRIIPGVEITTAYQEGLKDHFGIEILSSDDELHILGYKIDFHNLLLLNTLKKIRQAKDKRNGLIITKLQELGFDIELKEARKKAQCQAFGQLHIAKLLVEKRYFNTKQDVFSFLFNDEGKASFSKKKIKPEAAIEIITRAGGIPCLAHPGLIKKGIKQNELEIIIDNLINSGLQGIEAYYSLYDEKQQKWLLSLAKAKNLIVVGGSDFHGKNKDIQLGQAQVPEDILEQF